MWQIATEYEARVEEGRTRENREEGRSQEFTRHKPDGSGVRAIQDKTCDTKTETKDASQKIRE
jgi:hypothetical protein